MIATLQLIAPSQANLTTFSVWKDQDSAEVWNGTIWTTDTNANLILGATAQDTNAPASGRAYYSYTVPAGVAARNWFGIAYEQHGGSPAVGDMTGYASLGSGGLTELTVAYDAAKTAATQASVDAVGVIVGDISSGATVVRANNSAGSLISTAAQNATAVMTDAGDQATPATLGAMVKGLNSMLTASGSNSTYTVDALKNAPSGGGGGSSGYSDTAQGGTSSTITLATTANAVARSYVGQQIVINEGDASQDTANVTAYNATTKVATIDKTWVTTPTDATVYTFPGINTSVVNVTITPLQATVVSPRVALINIEIGQSEVVTYTWVILDADGDPVDLSGKTINFVAWNSPNGGVTQVEAFAYSTADHITVTGTDGNNVNVVFQAADTATAPATYSYSLVVATGGPYRLVTGTMKVTPGLLAPTL